MVARFRAIAVVGVGLAILLTITAAPAAPQANNPNNLRGPNNSPMTTCVREAGMWFDAYSRIMAYGSSRPWQPSRADLLQLP